MKAVEFFENYLAVASALNDKPMQRTQLWRDDEYFDIKNNKKGLLYFLLLRGLLLSLYSHQFLKTDLAVRAWYNLRNSYHQLGDSMKTAQYHRLIQQAQARGLYIYICMKYIYIYI